MHASETKNIYTRLLTRSPVERQLQGFLTLCQWVCDKARFMTFLLLVGGLIAGFIDSIAGGGGLITLPILILALGTPVEAIASNKIVGVVGAFVAMCVYRRAGHLDWRKGLSFSLWTAAGSLIGSTLSPFLPARFFQLAIGGICPVLLWIVWKKDSLLSRAYLNNEMQLKIAMNAKKQSSFAWPLVIAGLVCGIYDGAFGPGGGTFMLFGLLYVVKLPMLVAMAVTKLANTLSAGTALTRYAIGGYVHWLEGSCMACGMAVGAFIGARCASEKAAQWVRPVFTVVVVLLLVRVWTQF